MPNIALLGDIHGSALAVQECLMRIPTDTVAIIQLGDFGFWSHTDNGRRFLKQVNTLCEAARVPFYWIRGNHENSTLLYEQYDIPDGRGDDPVQMLPWVYHLPTGSTLELGNTSFLSCGGAWSIDHNFRKQGVSIWPGEEIVQEDIDLVIKNYKNQTVMLSHDCPSQVKFSSIVPPFNSLSGGRDFPSGLRQRKFLGQIKDACFFSHWFHGHYHCSHESAFDGPKRVQNHEKKTDWVVGLAAEYHRNNVCVLDCDDDTGKINDFYYPSKKIKFN